MKQVEAIPPLDVVYTRKPLCMLIIQAVRSPSLNRLAIQTTV